MSSKEWAVSRSLSVGPLSFLPSPIREPRRPTLAVLVGWATAFLPSLVLAMLATTLLPQVRQPQFDVDGTLALGLLVVFAPIVETLIMGTVLLILLRIVSPAAAVLISSFGWGVAHSMAAPMWGLVIWWPFLIFSTLFVTWRARSIFAAFGMAAAVHGLQNLLPALGIAWGNAL